MSSIDTIIFFLLNTILKEQLQILKFKMTIQSHHINIIYCKVSLTNQEPNMYHNNSN